MTGRGSLSPRVDRGRRSARSAGWSSFIHRRQPFGFVGGRDKRRGELAGLTGGQFGIVRLVIGAAEVDDLRSRYAGGGSSWARCRTRATGIRRRSSRTAYGCITASRSHPAGRVRPGTGPALRTTATGHAEARRSHRRRQYRAWGSTSRAHLDALTHSGLDLEAWTPRQLLDALNADMRATGWSWPNRRHCHVGECRRPGRIGGVSTATASYKGHR